MSPPARSSPSSDVPASRLAVARLKAALGDCERILVYCHMNPDPDSIASGISMRLLLTERLGRSAEVCYRGIIGRAENRQLHRLCAPELRPAREMDLSAFDAAVLVDAQPDYGYDARTDTLPLRVVIDHHPACPGTAGIPFADVRPGLGATSTILTEYLRALRIEPDARIATALYYGLKTDTQDLARRATEGDVAAYGYLQRRLDRKLLSAIENPPLTRAYFRQLRTAIENARTHGGVLFADLGRMGYPDMVAEVADRMLRLEGTSWSVIFGLFDHRTYVSIRTTVGNEDAGLVIRDVVAEEGVAGGHNTMAAARIDHGSDAEAGHATIVERLRGRFLDRLKENDREGVPLCEPPR